MRWVVLLAVTACTVNGDVPARPPALAGLPPPGSVDTDRFRDAGACAQCHLVADDTPVLHDAQGANVSPVLLWRSSLMALAARDPYYLAVFADELARAPANTAEIEALWTGEPSQSVTRADESAKRRGPAPSGPDVKAVVTRPRRAG